MEQELIDELLLMRQEMAIALNKVLVFTSTSKKFEDMPAANKRGLQILVKSQSECLDNIEKCIEDCGTEEVQ